MDDEDKSSIDTAALQRQMADLQKLVALQLQVMDTHTRAITDPSLRSTPTMSSQEVKHIKAPEGRYDMNSSEFRMYTKDWRDFKTLTRFTDEQLVLQMRLNMDADLKRAIDTNLGERWNTLSVEDALSAIKSTIKHTSNPAVFRKDFDGMTQNNGESVREFVTRLRSCALDCEYVCPFDESHDLTEYHIINRIRCGIADKQLQQELLQKADTIKCLKDVLAYCEIFESAKEDREKLRNDTPGISSVNTDDMTNEDIIAAISNYKKNKMDGTKKCYYCGFERHEKSKCPALGKNCTKCNRPNHFASVCRTRSTNKQSAAAAAVISTIKYIQSSSVASMSQLPKLSLAFMQNRNSKPTKLDAIADTGAQACVAGTEHMKKLGFRIEDLVVPSHELKHVGGSRLKVVGSHIMYVQHNDQLIEVEMYFISGITHIYLSIDACKMLYIIPQKFPYVDVRTLQPDSTSMTAGSVGLKKSEILDSPEKIVCQNPNLPVKPETLPYPAIPENIPKLKKWLLDSFSETTFNTRASVLPVMSGKPHKIHLKEGVIPFAAHTPIPIPHHWKEEVKTQLDRDVDVGIIQKAPIGEASEWCMRMVTVAKSDGSPRRTIDFQPINKSCIRETHYTPTPFSVVSNIPSNVYKSVVDAYNGYHQVALDKDSVKLTTFITEFGRYQYLRAPQGHIASGDAYTRRYDDIISGVKRKQKIVDDVLLYDTDIEQSFNHAFDFLTLCGKNGVTINPEKFQFAQEEVEFVGYNVGWDSYRPCDDMMSAIENFPMPENPTLSDIRSWYGLVNQIAPFVATSSLMTPFRELMKPTRAIGKQVFWDEELQCIFNETKVKLCELLTTGLAYYDVKRKTIVVTDWCKVGIGFVILQKHCKCKHEIVDSLCCDTGWKPVFCNSRHLDAREQEYCPIEGEALAVDWALKKGRLFLQGNDNFEIVVDHKPLVKIFGDKSLHDIENPLLLNFKEKSLAFTFTMKYVKGIKNHANTLSRYPVNNPDEDDTERSEACHAILVASVVKSAASISITMDSIRETIQSDDQYRRLYSAINNSSFAKTRAEELPQLKEFHSIKDRLSIVNGLIRYGFEGNNPRVLIPRALRNQVIKNLHAANQGSTSMLARARQTVYWPGLDRDINSHCDACLQCRENAPSKQKEPLVTSDIPEYPFQNVATDMFQIDGHWYLVYVDRLTGFAELAFFPTTTTSAQIINVFREFFHRWGVPEEMSLDGATNYNSNEIMNWLKSWGVNIRVSSAYYPQSNGRAEAGVKSLKRLLNGNVGPRGSINNDNVAMALLQYRNTPLRGVNKSPAQLALGRPIRDTLPLPRERYRIDPEWARHLHEREVTMSDRNATVKARYDKNAKVLKELKVGDAVLCQNERSKRWDKSGTVVEVKKNRQYMVRMTGSGRVSKQNRRHLQKIVAQALSTVNPPTKVHDMNDDMGDQAKHMTEADTFFLSKCIINFNC